MAAIRRRYSKPDKAKAVGLAMLKGVNAASEELGIPNTTLSYWMRHPEFDALRSKSRDEVAEQMWATIQIGVVEVAKGIVSDAPLRDKVVALGVLYDKHALLTGAATARTESRDITGTLSDAELVAALHTAERILREGGAADAVAGEAEG